MRFWLAMMASNEVYYWTAFMLIGMAIFAVNSFVIIKFVRFRPSILRRRNNRVLFSLALADFFVGLFSIIFAASMVTEQKPTVYKCLGNIPLFVSMFISIFSLTLLTFDRLIAILRPLRYPAIVTGKRLNISLFVSWMLTLCLLLLQYILFFCFSNQIELQVRGTLIIACFFLGATVLGITNCYLFVAISKQKDTLDQQTTSKLLNQSPKKILSLHEKVPKVKKSDFKSSKECIFIVLVFICSLLPLSIYRLLYTLGFKLNYIHARRLFLLLALLSSFINPWIYFFNKKQFRRYSLLRGRRNNDNGNCSIPN